MTIIDFTADFAPYRERAAALTGAIIAGQPDMLDEAAALFDDLEARFTVPLLEAYMALPFELRAGSTRADIDHKDAIAWLTDAFAGTSELSWLYDLAAGWADPDPDATGRAAEIGQAGVRYRELFGPVPS